MPKIPICALLSVSCFAQVPQGLAFYPITPCRAVDTRGTQGPLGGPELHGGQKRTYPISTAPCGIPTGAQAYSLNVSAIPREPLGYLKAWASGQPEPPTAIINATSGDTTSGSAIVQASVYGSIDVLASNPTNLVIDINGYFAPAATAVQSSPAAPGCTPTATAGVYKLPRSVKSVAVYRNGVRAGAPGDFTLSGDTVTLRAPIAKEAVLCDYVY